MWWRGNKNLLALKNNAFVIYVCKEIMLEFRSDAFLICCEGTQPSMIKTWSHCWKPQTTLRFSFIFAAEEHKLPWSRSDRTCAVLSITPCVEFTTFCNRRVDYWCILWPDIIRHCKVVILLVLINIIKKSFNIIFYCVRHIIRKYFKTDIFESVDCFLFLLILVLVFSNTIAHSLPPVVHASDSNVLKADTATCTFRMSSSWPKLDIHPSFLRRLYTTASVMRLLKLIIDPFSLLANTQTEQYY